MRSSDWSSDVCSSDLLQHQTSTPGRRHEGTHPAKGLHRRPAGKGECKDETDAQSRLTQARPDAGRLSGDYRLRTVISKRPCLCLLAPFDRMRPPGRYRLSHLGKIGRAHVCTPVTNEQLVCRLLIAKKKS